MVAAVARPIGRPRVRVPLNAPIAFRAAHNIIVTGGPRTRYNRINNNFCTRAVRYFNNYTFFEYYSSIIVLFLSFFRGETRHVSPTHKILWSVGTRAGGENGR